MSRRPDPTPRPRVVELFAGVGGFRLGLEPHGFQTVWANQWEPSTRTQHAFDCYVRHFGDSPGHVCDDIEHALDEVEAGRAELPDHELLVGGFPCFAAGTMILTAAGHRPIEEVAVGDLVLTHTGQWRRVTAVMSRQAEETVVIRGHGLPDIRTTAEHPFWARTRGHRWDDQLHRNVRAFGQPGWILARDIGPSTYLAQVRPIEHVPAPVDLDQTLDFYWLVGRYLADGWRTRPSGKGRVVICADVAEADEIEARIRRVFPCTRSAERTAVKFHITRVAFYDWLEAFGSGAGGKRIPGWMLGVDPVRLCALLDGYATGDGSPWQGGWRSTTVSRALALGIAMLVQVANGLVASIRETHVPTTTLIEGRTVQQRTQYQVVVPPRNRSAFVEGHLGWKLVRSRRLGPAATVFNLSVDEDESYVADGCAVHNCQDYSVARTLNQARGLQGRKGVLWWQIHRLLDMRRPPFLFLENVDRLLKSPAAQRGRDFAVMLATLDDLGYEVEWRVVNAADYGFPQKRRRVYIVGRLAGAEPRDPNDVLHRGVLGRALPVSGGQPFSMLETLRIDGDPAEISDDFGARSGPTPFRNAGYCSHRRVWTADLEPAYAGPRTTLGDILEDAADIPDAYRIPDRQLADWRYLKGAKREPRQHKASGTPYLYAEGALPFPDRTDGPARTILTAEGGATPSRFKHVVATADGGFRRLTPRELERLNGFPDDWTDTGMPEGRRAFAMGNALVVGIVDRIGAELAKDAELAKELPAPELRSSEPTAD
jgi:DNA (cytosine-5)-methyltransferase 1